MSLSPVSLMKNRWYLLCLLGIFIFYFINNLIWLSKDTLPPGWDQGVHLNICLTYFRHLVPSFLSANFTKLLDISHYHPPFFYITSLPFLAILNFSHHVAVYTNFFYLIILIFSTYSISKFFFNKATGVGAVIILLLYPMVYALSRELLLDFPLLAMVSLTHYTILISEAGLDIRRSWAFGITMGLSFLTRPSALIFIIGGWLFIFITILIRKRKLTGGLQGRNLISLLICGILMLSIILPWYLRSCEDLATIFAYSNSISAIREGDPDPLAIKSFAWYFSAKDILISKSLYFFLLLTLVILFIKRKKQRGIGYLLTWIVTSYLLLVIAHNKDARYIVSALPPIAILTSAGLVNIRFRSIKYMLWVVLVLISIGQFYQISFGWPKEKPHPYAHHPIKEDWRIKEILLSLSSHLPNKALKIGILPSQPYFNIGNFSFYMNFLELPYYPVFLGEIPITEDMIKDCDVFISKNPFLSVKHLSLYRDEAHKSFIETGKIKQLGFKLWKEFFLPDHSKAQVYIKQILKPEATIDDIIKLCNETTIQASD